MSQGDKSKDLNLGDKSGVPTVEDHVGTEGFNNTFAKDASTSISCFEYNEGVSSMKYHMNEMLNMLRVLMYHMPQTDTTNIMPNIPKLGERDIISQAHDDGSSAIPPIPLTGNGSGIYAAVPPPPNNS